MELFKDLAKTSAQVLVSLGLLIAQVEVITWIILAFWGIRLALHFLRKDAESRCYW